MSLACQCFEAVQRTWSGACFYAGNTPFTASEAERSSLPRAYRNLLWRRWSDEGPNMGVVMLNPSTADEYVLDPTLRRVDGFAKRYGFGGFIIANAFAYRSTSPYELPALEAAVGSANNWHLAELTRQAGLIVVGWGSHLERPALKPRLPHLRNALDGVPLYCWGRTKNGSPRHPLYIRGDTALEQFEWT